MLQKEFDIFLQSDYNNILYHYIIIDFCAHFNATIVTNSVIFSESFLIIAYFRAKVKGRAHNF